MNKKIIYIALIIIVLGYFGLNFIGDKLTNTDDVVASVSCSNLSIALIQHTDKNSIAGKDVYYKYEVKKGSQTYSIPFKTSESFPIELQPAAYSILNPQIDTLRTTMNRSVRIVYIDPSTFTKDEYKTIAACMHDPLLMREYGTDLRATVSPSNADYVVYATPAQVALTKDFLCSDGRYAVVANGVVALTTGSEIDANLQAPKPGWYSPVFTEEMVGYVSDQGVTTLVAKEQTNRVEQKIQDIAQFKRDTPCLANGTSCAAWVKDTLAEAQQTLERLKKEAANTTDRAQILPTCKNSAGVAITDFFKKWSAQVERS